MGWQEERTVKVKGRCKPERLAFKRKRRIPLIKNGKVLTEEKVVRRKESRTERHIKAIRKDKVRQKESQKER
jgi:hypothetical protein